VTGLSGRSTRTADHLAFEPFARHSLTFTGG
jgi:hypothetical protein